ncbi:L,D-transpeptidase [Bradyrhizobium sp. ISRA443]|uniref:L,D-transpeptidase n=1 Tax=unclassified Bradyrhizobium TaxID=2631580 RepID=UPI00247A3A78|nr:MULTISPECIES: L,D-transpeptidase [unclassified Bradyrhizobium]WGR92367.1 L,D-transpeptidase [Bradyrhizobium sp. ISRA435]WGR96710.1 L,D-transpeptidase [Bradyrhizobium sp. ISRA436]WGS03597.1 L,D-transpeptidase [Bradyrhizobium sp. ISRA437]WGS10481.1 L,D-transpeptidase [Bradyrhizobium sp. ISRA443]
MRANGSRPSILDFANERFWQFAILTAAGTVGASTQADAALYYWNGPDSAYYGEPEPLPVPHRPKVRRNPVKKDIVAGKETVAKPQGPLIIAIAIEQQKVRIYDANGLYAESPVSTGMKGHSTPMGVFSVIQKQKYHRSNIYSGAPMPYMQRITWSGIAMHAGVLPGYPASHGCIRMPTAFAVKMYNWTRMGARVVITPGTITPENFSHPLLVTQKVAPQQPVADDLLKKDAPLGVKGDKGADKPETSLELRSTVGHADQHGSLRDNTHTADASGTTPSASAAVTMSDAPAAAVPDDTTADTRSADATSDDTTVGETGSIEAKSEVSAGDHVKAEVRADAPKTDAKANLAGAEAPKVDTVTGNDARVGGAAATADKPAAAADAPDAKKDPARLPGLANLDVPKRGGQIAVFISRKDSKLYVRQNFAPLFDVPVTIAPSDRPLGTHVFTAEADKKNPNLLRWSVVSLPVSTRSAVRIEAQDRTSHRRKMAGAAAIEAKSLPLPDSPAEALDRITIPADAMARINEALGTGGSIIVSDLGVNQGETGEGTDFIVPLR